MHLPSQNNFPRHAGKNIFSEAEKSSSFALYTFCLPLLGQTGNAFFLNSYLFCPHHLLLTFIQANLKRSLFYYILLDQGFPLTTPLFRASLFGWVNRVFRFFYDGCKRACQSCHTLYFGRDYYLRCFAVCCFFKGFEAS